MKQAETPVDRLPLIDYGALRDMEGDFGDSLPVRSFACDFVRIWEGRYDRLTTAVSIRDRSEALKAVVSLETAATMVGARRLAARATTLEQVVRSGDLDSAECSLEELHSCGCRTVLELVANYIDSE